jgi:hypothetical protein
VALKRGFAPVAFNERRGREGRYKPPRLREGLHPAARRPLGLVYRLARTKMGASISTIWPLASGTTRRGPLPTPSTSWLIDACTAPTHRGSSDPADRPGWKSLEPGYPASAQASPSAFGSSSRLGGAPVKADAPDVQASTSRHDPECGYRRPGRSTGGMRVHDIAAAVAERLDGPIAKASIKSCLWLHAQSDWSRFEQLGQGRYRLRFDSSTGSRN